MPYFENFSLLLLLCCAVLAAAAVADRLHLHQLLAMCSSAKLKLCLQMGHGCT